MTYEELNKEIEKINLQKQTVLPQMKRMASGELRLGTNGTETLRISEYPQYIQTTIHVLLDVAAKAKEEELKRQETELMNTLATMSNKSSKKTRRIFDEDDDY